MINNQPASNSGIHQPELQYGNNFELTEKQMENVQQKWTFGSVNTQDHLTYQRVSYLQTKTDKE